MMGAVLAAVAAARAETWTLELKRLDAPVAGDAVATAPEDDSIYRAVSSQTFFKMIGEEGKTQGGSPGVDEQEAAFKRIVKKEPKYQAKHPFRGVAKLGSREYAFALDIAPAQPEAKDKADAKAAEAKSNPDAAAGSWAGRLLRAFSRSSPPEAKLVAYNRLYFDLNGNGDLTDDKVVEAASVTGSPPWANFQFPRVDLAIDVAGTKLHYSFLLSGSGAIAVEGGYASVELSAAAYREGDIVLDGKKHHVVLLDFNSNGRFDDEVQFIAAGQGPAAQLNLELGDMLLVDPKPAQQEPNWFGWGPIVADGMLSKLVKIDDRFYEVKVSPIGDQLTLTPTSVSLGNVTNPNDGYRATIYSDRCVRTISGKKGEPVPVPEGQWRLYSYTIDRTEQQKQGPAPEAKAQTSGPRSLWDALVQTLGEVLGGGEADMVFEQPRQTVVSAQATGVYKPVTVRPGETVVMPFGPPYTPRVTADTRSADKKELSLEMSLVGSAGEECIDLRIEGNRPQKPAFTITDDKGKVVESGNFEYG